MRVQLYTCQLNDDAYNSIQLYTCQLDDDAYNSISK